jgi:hypothetical protein
LRSPYFLSYLGSLSGTPLSFSSTNAVNAGLTNGSNPAATAPPAPAPSPSAARQATSGPAAAVAIPAQRAVSPK